MATDKKKLVIHKNGQNSPYFVEAKDVNLGTRENPEFLPDRLEQMEEDIADAAQSGGEGGYTPPADGIPKTDLAQSVQTSLGLADSALQVADKTQLQGAINSLQNALNNLIGGNVQDAIDTFNEVVAFLNGIDTSDPTLKNQLLALNTAITNLGNSLATVATSGSYNDLSNKPTILSQQQVAGMIEDAIEDLPTGDTVSVTTNQDGTFTIHVGETDYTINLNHTHEGMAKLVKCTEATLPQTLANDTIYVQVDDATNPTEIEKLYLFGLEFAGGSGSADDGQPKVTSPTDGSTLNLGDHHGQAVSQSVVVRAKNLNYGGSTDGLTIEAIGTGLTLAYGQSTGQSSITIPQTNGSVNTEVTVTYSGNVSLSGGELRIKQGSTLLASLDVTAALVLPQGWLANKAWNQVDANTAPVLIDAPGYCVTERYVMQTNTSYDVDFGFIRDENQPTVNYGVAVGASNMMASQTAVTSYWASKTGTSRTFTNGNTGYGSGTFLMSELDNCYLRVTGGAYLFKGNNVT